MMHKYGLYFAWLIACFATLGSLYFSEVRHIEPCHLCWYQRIAIYPMVVILAIASYRNFLGIIPYVLPVVLIGLFIAAYHVMIMEIPSWQVLELCGAGPRCEEKVNIGLGPITIPILSLGSFVLLSAVLIATIKRE